MRAFGSWPVALVVLGWFAYDRGLAPHASVAVAEPTSSTGSLLSPPFVPKPAEHVPLDQKVSWEFVEAELKDVVHYLECDLKVPIKCDMQSLNNAGVGLEQPITFRMDRVRARTAIDLMLRDYELVARWEDDCLVIRHQSEQGPLTNRLYPVKDLVSCEDEKGIVSDYDSIIDAITCSIDPTSWKESGTGEGTICPLPAAESILISNSEKVHQQVADLLTTLRAARELQGMRGPTKIRQPQPYGGCFGGFNGAIGPSAGPALQGGGFSGGLF